MHLMAKYVSPYRSDRFLRADVDMGNYCNLDLHLIYHLPTLHTELFIVATNLPDVRYSTVSPLYPDFGRQLRAGLRYNF
jgi:iron complex outermembrane receptor protein